MLRSLGISVLVVVGTIVLELIATCISTECGRETLIRVIPAAIVFGVGAGVLHQWTQRRERALERFLKDVTQALTDHIGKYDARAAMQADPRLKAYMDEPPPSGSSGEGLSPRE